MRLADERASANEVRKTNGVKLTRPLLLRAPAQPLAGACDGSHGLAGPMVPPVRAGAGPEALRRRLGRADGGRRLGVALQGHSHLLQSGQGEEPRSPTLSGFSPSLLACVVKVLLPSPLSFVGPTLYSLDRAAVGPLSQNFRLSVRVAAVLGACVTKDLSTTLPKDVASPSFFRFAGMPSFLLSTL